MYHLFAELERRRKAKETFEHQRQNALQGYINGVEIIEWQRGSAAEIRD